MSYYNLLLGPWAGSQYLANLQNSGHLSIQHLHKLASTAIFVIDKFAGQHLFIFSNLCSCQSCGGSRAFSGAVFDYPLLFNQIESM